MTELGERKNSGKSRYDLLPAFAIEELVKVLTYGANKYSDRNWEKGLSWTETFGSLMRHAWAWMKGEDRDKESQCLHMAHVACNALFLVEFYYTCKGDETRPYGNKTNPNSPFHAPALVPYALDFTKACRVCRRATIYGKSVCPEHKDAP